MRKRAPRIPVRTAVAALLALASGSVADPQVPAGRVDDASPPGHTLPFSADEETSQAQAEPDYVLQWLLRTRWWHATPLPPTAPVVSHATADSLTVAWTPPEDSLFDIVGYDLQYRVSGAVEFRDWEHAGASTQVTIDGLAEATRYEVRVRANDELDSGDWSVLATGMTADATPVFSEGRSTSREVAENALADEDIGAPLVATAGGNVLHYGLEGPDADAFSMDAGSGQLRTRAGVSHDHETRDRYALTVTATDARGRTASILVTVLVSDVDEPPGAPDTPRVVSASSSRLTVEWTEPENTGPPIEGYDVEVRAPDGEFSDGGHEGTGTTARLEGLRRGTRHLFRVRASNPEGTGPWSETGSGRTSGGGGGGGGGVRPPPPPPPPGNRPPSFTGTTEFTVPENTSRAGTVTADDPDSGDAVTGYAITGGADGNAFTIDAAGTLYFLTAPDFEVPTDARSTAPANDPRDNTYVLTVTATAGSGSRTLSADQTVTITVANVAELPARPTAPTVSSSSTDSLTVHWSEPATDGPLVRDYDLQYRVVGSTGDFDDWDHAGAAFVATIESLPSATEHEVQVRARNDDGVSLWSPSGRGTTVDSTPSVTGVTFVSDAGPDEKYLLGDTIEVAATFSEPVEVDTTDGTPQIGLTIGSTPRRADYVRGSTRSVLVFSYEVTASDADTNGASVTGASLTANSGTIRKRGSTVNATLAHGALSDQSAHQVDGSSASTTRPGSDVETFPFNASGTYADDLQACIYFSPSTLNCNFSRLPYLGAETDNPSRSDIMGRLLVSHRWMGENFGDMLARMPYEVRLLFRSVRAVVIASDIRPAYYSAFRGAIFLDPAFVALTPEQRATISDAPDYRRNFGQDLQFESPLRFVRNNRWLRAHSGPDGSRSVETMMPFLGYLLLHELAHAADYIHPDRIADFFDSERPQDVADNRGSKNLTATHPLTSQTLNDLAGVSFFGNTPTDAQKALLPTDLVSEFASDGAVHYYSYATIREDFANNFDAVMMSFLFRTDTDVALTNKGSDPDTPSDNVVAWGQRGRIGDSAVVDRVRSVVQTIYSGEADILGSLEHHIDNLPAPRAMRTGDTWLENVVLGAGANQAPPASHRPPETVGDDVLSTRLPQ